MDDLQQLFKKIEDNIFDTQEDNQKSSENIDPNLPSTTLESKSPKKSKIRKITTEIKENRLSKLHLENPKEPEAIQEESKDKEVPLVFGDEYSDYGRQDKTGIHFQIISDINVSIEIVPAELITKEVKEIIMKYQGVFDVTMKLWLIPYVNYQKLFTELFQIESLRNKLHKVGAIAQEYYINKELDKLIIRRKKQDEILDYSTDDIKQRDYNQLPEKIKKSLYKFQLEGIKFGIEHHCRFLLADEMGVGKTLQAISLSYIYRDSWPVLVVCPGSMKYNWKGEIQTWLGLKDHRICILNSSKQKISQVAYFYIISYDLMRNVIKKMREISFQFVILDEAHSIKNKDSLRAKNILPIAVRAKRLIIMTGTPLLAKPYEGYPLLYALRPDIFCYFKKFAYRYCDPQPTPMGINWSGTSNTKELHWILSCLMVRRLKRDVLQQLPPKRRQKIWIRTDEKVIEEIKKVRLQVFGRKGTLECYSLTSKAKINGVKEYISDIIDAKEKFIVFAYHYEMLNSLEELCKNKKIDYMRIDGNTKQDKRYENVKYFQTDENCQVAILSIIAASTGITLTATNMVIFAELTWTPSIMIQAEDRVHRIGQTSEFVDIKYLYGPETLDDFILDKLQKKLTIVSTTLDDKKEILGVKADPKLVNIGSKQSDFIKYNGGDLCEEYDLCEGDDIEKKLFDDLGDTSNKKQIEKEKIKEKEKTGIKNKKRKKKKKKKNNKTNMKKNKKIKGNKENKNKESDDESNSDDDIQEIINSNKDESREKIRYPKEETQEGNVPNNTEINLGKVFNTILDSKKKEIIYPKESKSKSKSKSKNKSKNMKNKTSSDVKVTGGSKISGIKELRKYWASTHKGKSVNKITKNKNKLEKDNTSKNTALTLIPKNNIKRDKETQIQIDAQKREEKMDLFLEELYNNHEKNTKETADLNPKSEYAQYEKDLMVNLHKVNMRRSIGVNNSQQSLIDRIEMPKKDIQSDNKRKVIQKERNPFNENIDENIVQNAIDKIPLI